MLTKDEVLDVVELKKHGENRINHTRCGDTKQRLYFRHIPLSGWVAHCHNCGESGFFHDKDSIYRPEEIGNSIDLKNYENLSETSVMSSVLNDKAGFVNDSVRLWLYGYGLDYDDLVANYNIHGDGHILRLRYINESGKTEVCQSRLFERATTNANRPKYITYKWVPNPFVYYPSKKNVNGPIVLTEDMLSAIKVNMAGFNSVALLGTHLSEYVEQKLLHIPGSDMLIWLDNDPPGIKAAMNIFAHLSPLCSDPNIVIVHEPQPKECSLEFIRKVVCDLTT